MELFDDRHFQGTTVVVFRCSRCAACSVKLFFFFPLLLLTCPLAAYFSGYELPLTATMG